MHPDRKRASAYHADGVLTHPPCPGQPAEHRDRVTGHVNNSMRVPSPHTGLLRVHADLWNQHSHHITKVSSDR